MPCLPSIAVLTLVALAEARRVKSITVYTCALMYSHRDVLMLCAMT